MQNFTYQVNNQASLLLLKKEYFTQKYQFFSNIYVMDSKKEGFAQFNKK